MRQSTPPHNKVRSDRQILRDAWPMLRPDLSMYTLAMLIAPLTAAMVIVQPWLLQRAIDGPIMAGDAEGAVKIAWLYLAAISLQFIAQGAHTLALSTAAMRTIARVRASVYQHTLTRAARFFDHQPAGRLLTRATSDVEALGETLTAGAITIVLDALQVAGVLAAMLWIDAGLTLTLLVVAPVLVLVVELLRRKLKTLYLRIRNSLAELNAYLSERLDGIETVQLYSDEERTLAGFDSRLDRYRKATIRTNVYDAFLYAIVDGIGSITLALMLWYGSGGGVGDLVSVGVLAAFIDYTGRLFRPIQEFSQKIAALQRAGAALQKILSLLDVDDKISEGDQSLAVVKGHLKFDHVSFRYAPDGPEILHDISLDVKPREVIALVGRTGSGKTTLGRLLQRTYDGFSGAITLDGIPITSLSTAQVRGAVAAVSQDVQLLPGTLRFNLTLGRDHTDEHIMHILKLVHADEIAMRLGGLDGHVEDSGRNLSSGEAQLLSFARTMLADPQIVVLDEATASVDSLTEAKLQQATAAVLSCKTTIVIAHRLSTIVNADRIIVLSYGKIIEQGNHQTLLAQGGAYAELFTQQQHPTAT